MLAERAANLSAKIKDLENQRRGVEKAELYRNRAAQLSDPAEKLAPLARVRELFRERSIAVGLDQALLSGLTAQVKKFAEEYEKDAESIIAPDGLLRHKFWEPLKAFPDKVDEALTDTWSSHIDRLLPTGNSELLLVLKRVPGFSDAVREIEQGALRAQQLKTTLPISSDFEEVEKLAVSLKAAWARLHGDEISPVIRDFLMNASQGKATLDQVTHEVQDWLNRHKLMKAFKVTL